LADLQVKRLRPVAAWASMAMSCSSCSKTEVEEGLTDPDDVPAPPDAAVTQPGDLWILGNHRLTLR
jgi:hypothetical protein